MSFKFAIFSTDRGASVSPLTLAPAPATLIDLGEDPLFVYYDPNAGSKGRGSRMTTLGGRPESVHPVQWDRGIQWCGCQMGFGDRGFLPFRHHTVHLRSLHVCFLHPGK